MRGKCKGEVKVMINMQLAEERGLTQEDMERVEEVHQLLQGSFEVMERLSPQKKSDTEALRGLVKVVSAYEETLQALWGFEVDIGNHTWWFRAPHCLCPKRDNLESFNMGTRIIHRGCPLHGINSKPGGKDAT